jgi:plasmid stabilization system protein ParE
MQHYSVELLPAAWLDLDEIFDYILLYNANAAVRTYNKIFKRLKSLEETPLSYPKARNEQLRLQDYRVLICGKYLCFFRVIGQKVFVYHIVHGARNYPILFDGDDTIDN